MGQPPGPFAQPLLLHALASGARILAVVFVTVLRIPQPTEFQALVFRVMLALAAAGAGEADANRLNFSSRSILREPRPVWHTSLNLLLSRDKIRWRARFS